MRPLPLDLEERCNRLRWGFDAADEAGTRWPKHAPQEFVAQVLPVEVDRLRAGFDRPERRPGLLVLLCGFSPQPLLVSVAWLRPVRVLLVGSDSGEGRTAVTEFLSLAHSMGTRGLVECTFLPERVWLPASEPTAAYAGLLAGVRSAMAEHGVSEEDVVVDITGGKKTMVAAAYLVASHLGVETVYVDGEYSKNLRMPRPCTGEVSRLRDPVAVFRLREVERASTLFEEGRYRAAARLLDEAAAAVVQVAQHGAPPPHLPDDLRLRAAGARAADLWRQAAYTEAREVLDRAGTSVPPPLAALADAWNVGPGDGRPGGRRLRTFARHDRGELLLRFAADRVAWALRAWHGAGARRDAFLAAFAACEVAVEGLVHALLRRKAWCVEGIPNAREWRDVVSRAGVTEKAALEVLRTGRSVPRLATGDGVVGMGNACDVVFVGEVREHRNDLIHQADALDEEIAGSLMEGSPPACVALLRAVGTVLGLDEGSTERLINGALDRGSVEWLGRPEPAQSAACPSSI